MASDNLAVDFLMRSKHLKPLNFQNKMRSLTEGEEFKEQQFFVTAGLMGQVSWAQLARLASAGVVVMAFDIEAFAQVAADRDWGFDTGRSACICPWPSELTAQFLSCLDLSYILLIVVL